MQRLLKGRFDSVTRSFQVLGMKPCRHIGFLDMEEDEADEPTVPRRDYSRDHPSGHASTGPQPYNPFVKPKLFTELDPAGL